MDKSEESVRGVVLVGHGGVAKDCPRDLVRRFKALEAQRSLCGAEPTEEERELDEQIRRWPRTPATDPYKAGLECLAAGLQPLLAGERLVVAYNEFCAPSLEEAVEGLVSGGATTITVLTSMLTPGGVHSAVEIPQILDRLRQRYPSVDLRYAWPFDMNRVARMLADHMHQFTEPGYSPNFASSSAEVFDRADLLSMVENREGRR
jgi:sirohydrochlorin cobaltochelatase